MCIEIYLKIFNFDPMKKFGALKVHFCSSISCVHEWMEMERDYLLFVGIEQFFETYNSFYSQSLLLGWIVEWNQVEKKNTK